MSSAFRFDLYKPCNNCPFLKSDPIFDLPQDRREGIVDSLLHDKTFCCHKTTGRPVEQQCAGALIMLNREDKLNNNFLFRLAQMIGLLDAKKLMMDAPIMSIEEFLAGLVNR